MGEVFREQLPSETLDEFLKRKVIPTEEEIAELNADVDQFVRFLQTEFAHPPYTVAEVRKSGSLAKGTAVRGTADIDLVVFVNGIKNITQLGKKSRRKLLQALDSTVRNYPQWRGRLREKKRSRFSRSYYFDGNEVDILPTIDILEMHNDDPKAVYTSMRRDRSRCKRAQAVGQQYSAALAPLQVAIVKELPGYIKDVIRLLKYWKKEHHLQIRSYSLELLAKYVWEKNGWKSTTDLFRECMKELTTCNRFTISFDVHYNSAEYTWGMEPPYILDPANPYMKTMGSENNRATRRAANEALVQLR